MFNVTGRYQSGGILVPVRACCSTQIWLSAVHCLLDYWSSDWTVRTQKYLVKPKASSSSIQYIIFLKASMFTVPFGAVSSDNSS